MIPLLPHQEEAINHIINKCSSQKGLILYHQMGTGKTITALSFFLHFSKKITKTVLICPDEVKSIWINEMGKLKLPNILIDKIISFKELDKLKKINLKSTVIVIDECHNIIDWFYNNRDKVKPVIKKLQECKKILLLTGTPVYRDESDILFLVNIAAGKDIVPYHSDQFREKYFRTKILKSVIQGWGVKFFKYNYIGRYDNLFTNLQVKTLKSIVPVIKYVLEVNLRNSHINNTIKTIDNMLSYNEKFQLIPRLGKILKPYAKEHLETALQTKSSFIDDLSKVYFTNIFSLVLQLLSSYLKRKDNTKIHDFQEIDSKKFNKDISPYISYYSISSLKGFPNVKTKVEYLEYSEYQISLWLKANFEEFDEQLNLDNNLFLKNYDNQEQFKKNGRIIGNLELKDYPLKFKKIFNIIEGYQAVIYSNFHEKGALLFSNFLTKMKYSYAYITPQMKLKDINKVIEKFKNKEIKCLILHHKMTEGISILGANQLHILEPIETLAKYEQVQARVIRYKSHSHLDSNNQQVTIYNWITIMESLKTRLSTKMQFAKKWAKTYSMTVPDELSYKYTYNMLLTPDQLVYNHNSKMNHFINNLKDVLKNKPQICAK